MTLKLFIFTWGLLLTAALMDVVGVFIIKIKINELGAVNFDSLRTILKYCLMLAKSPLAIVGGVFILISPLPYTIALSRMEISTVYPVSVALNFLILIPLTIIFLGENLTISKITGIFLVIVSLYLLYK